MSGEYSRLIDSRGEFKVALLHGKSDEKKGPRVARIYEARDAGFKLKSDALFPQGRLLLDTSRGTYLTHVGGLVNISAAQKGLLDAVSPLNFKKEFTVGKQWKYRPAGTIDIDQWKQIGVIRRLTVDLVEFEADYPNHLVEQTPNMAFSAAAHIIAELYRPPDLSS